MSTPARQPVSRDQKFSRQWRQMHSDVEALKRRPVPTADPSGEIQFGDVILASERLETGDILVTIRSAVTSTPPIILARFPGG